MKLCFPVEKNEGLDSKVFGHFGSAPMFLVVDADEGRVGGIGGGALMGLSQAGIRVFEAGAPTVSENVALARRGVSRLGNRVIPAAAVARGTGVAITVTEAEGEMNFRP